MIASLEKEKAKEAKKQFNTKTFPNLCVISDSFVDAARVLVNSGQIGVCVGKGWIDLNGAQIARDGVVQITHFLQRVPHVRIRVRECRVNSGEGMNETMRI